MKTIIRILIMAIMAFLSLSCDKDNPDYPDVEIMVKDASSGKDSAADFTITHLYINGFEKGKSSFTSTISSSSVDFSLCFNLSDINNLKVGHRIDIESFSFGSLSSYLSMLSSSNSTHSAGGSTSDYSGSVWLIKKDEKEVVLQFKKLRCKIDYAQFDINGCITCPLEEKAPSRY